MSGRRFTIRNLAGEVLYEGKAANAKKFIESLVEQKSCFAGADLRGWALNHLDLNGLNFQGADLSGARMTGTSICGSNFSGAKLCGVDADGLIEIFDCGWEISFTELRCSTLVENRCLVLGLLSRDGNDG